ncbi:hypothetical protein P3W83_14915 [Cupriavidus basilensis]|nr:hypothetical protein [Cupriavidus basilensis]
MQYIHDLSINWQRFAPFEPGDFPRYRKRTGQAAISDAPCRSEGMRSHARLRAWLAGTGRGTQPVAAIAIRLPDGGKVKVPALVVHHDAGRLQALPVQRSTGTDGQARQDAGGRPATT